MALSPACTVNSSTPPVDVTAGATVTVALVSAAGVGTWFLKVIGCDDSSTLATIQASLSINQTNKTATFTAPSGLGSAVILQSTVGAPNSNSSQGSGRDVNGVVQSDYTTTFKVNVPTSLGNRVLVPLEVTEQDPTNGWTSLLNGVTRSITSSGPTGGQTNLTLANGLNSNIDPAGKQTLRIGGPTGAFSLGGFKGGAAGLFLLVTNTTSQPMTIVHEDVSSTAANRIDCQQGGASVDLQPKVGSALLMYDNSESRWLLQNVGVHRPIVFNVRDYGAVGDGTTDDTTAIQAACDAAATTLLALPNGIYDSGQQLSVEVHFPGKSFRVTAEISVKPGVSLVGNHYALLKALTTDTFSILRTGGDNRIRHLAFFGAKHHVTVYGASAHYGVALGSEQGSYPNVFEHCCFKYASGPSCYIDPTPKSSGGSFTNGVPNTAASFIFRDCEIIGPCAYYGCADNVEYQQCYCQFDQTTPATDDNGKALGFWTSTDHIAVHDCVGVPGPSNNTPWFEGCGMFKVDDFRFGGEANFPPFRVRKNLTLYGLAAGIAWDTPSEIYVDRCEVTCVSGHAFVEVYDEFPRVISLSQGIGIDPSNNYSGGTQLSGVWGYVWVDLNTCPLTSFRNRSVQGLQILVEGTNDVNGLRFYGSTASPAQDPTGMVDLGPVLRKAFNSHLPIQRSEAAQNNLFTNGIVKITDFTHSGTAPFGSNDTRTGYTLNTVTASADGQTCIVGTSAAWNGPIGEYALSFAVESTFGGVLALAYTLVPTAHATSHAYSSGDIMSPGNGYWYECTTAGTSAGSAPTFGTTTGSTTTDGGAVFTCRGPNFVQIGYARLDGSGEWARVGCNFYHDGIPKTFSASMSDMPNGSNFGVGLPALHAGRFIHPYLYTVDSPTSPTQNVTAEGLAWGTYYGTAAPTNGSYIVGDRVLNTAPAANSPVMWVCSTTGSPGTWQAVYAGAQALARGYAQAGAQSNVTTTTPWEIVRVAFTPTKTGKCRISVAGNVNNSQSFYVTAGIGYKIDTSNSGATSVDTGIFSESMANGQNTSISFLADDFAINARTLTVGTTYYVHVVLTPGASPQFSVVANGVQIIVDEEPT